MRWRELEGRLAARLDRAAARMALDALVAEVGGRRLRVPLRPALDRAAVRREVREGATVREVAERYSVSARTVRRVVRGS